MRSDEISQSIAPVIDEQKRVDIGGPANIRAILRVGNDYFLRTLDRLAVMHDKDLISAVIFTAIWTANVKHITYSDANGEFRGIDDIPPDGYRRPVSVLALSSSLRIPYETVRRHVQALLARGLCVRTGGKGVVVPAAVLDRPLYRQAIAGEVPNFLQFLQELKRSGFDFAPYRRRHAGTLPLPAQGNLPENVRALVRVALELIMRGIDVLGHVHGDDLLKGFVFTAIWTANVRHITASANNLKYGALTELPPDEMRRPVSIKALADALRMPYETVRRHATNLVREGIAIRTNDKGLIIPSAQMEAPEKYEGIRMSHAHITRMVADLHRAGFDFSDY